MAKQFRVNRCNLVRARKAFRSQKVWNFCSPSLFVNINHQQSNQEHSESELYQLMPKTKRTSDPRNANKSAQVRLKRLETRTG